MKVPASPLRVITMHLHMEDEAKMIADIRAVHQKLIDLVAGMNDVRERYTDQDLVRYADVGQVRLDAKRLHDMAVWLGSIADSLNDREVMKNGNHQKSA